MGWLGDFIYTQKLSSDFRREDRRYRNGGRACSGVDTEGRKEILPEEYLPFAYSLINASANSKVSEKHGSKAIDFNALIEDIHSNEVGSNYPFFTDKMNSLLNDLHRYSAQYEDSNIHGCNSNIFGVNSFEECAQHNIDYTINNILKEKKNIKNHIALNLAIQHALKNDMFTAEQMIAKLNTELAQKIINAMAISNGQADEMVKAFKAASVKTNTAKAVSASEHKETPAAVAAISEPKKEMQTKEAVADSEVAEVTAEDAKSTEAALNMLLNNKAVVKYLIGQLSDVLPKSVIDEILSDEEKSEKEEPVKEATVEEVKEAKNTSEDKAEPEYTVIDAAKKADSKDKPAEAEVVTIEAEVAAATEEYKEKVSEEDPVEKQAQIIIEEINNNNTAYHAAYPYISKLTAIVQDCGKQIIYDKSANSTSNQVMNLLFYTVIDVAKSAELRAQNQNNTQYCETQYGFIDPFRMYGDSVRILVPNNADAQQDFRNVMDWTRYIVNALYVPISFTEVVKNIINAKPIADADITRIFSKLPQELISRKEGDKDYHLLEKVDFSNLKRGKFNGMNIDDYNTLVKNIVSILNKPDTPLARYRLEVKDANHFKMISDANTTSGNVPTYITYEPDHVKAQTTPIVIEFAAESPSPAATMTTTKPVSIPVNPIAATA